MFLLTPLQRSITHAHAPPEQLSQLTALSHSTYILRSPGSCLAKLWHPDFSYPAAALRVSEFVFEWWWLVVVVTSVWAHAFLGGLCCLWRQGLTSGTLLAKNLFN